MRLSCTQAWSHAPLPLRVKYKMSAQAGVSLNQRDKYSWGSKAYPLATAPSNLKIQIMRVWALGMLQSAGRAEHRHMLCHTCSWRRSARCDHQCSMSTAARPDDQSTPTPYERIKRQPIHIFISAMRNFRTHVSDPHISTTMAMARVLQIWDWQTCMCVFVGKYI